MADRRLETIPFPHLGSMVMGTPCVMQEVEPSPGIHTAVEMHSALDFVHYLQTCINLTDTDTKYRVWRGHACRGHRFVSKLVRNVQIREQVDILTNSYMNQDSPRRKPLGKRQFILKQNEHFDIEVTCENVSRVVRSLAYRHIEQRLIYEFLLQCNNDLINFELRLTRIEEHMEHMISAKRSMLTTFHREYGEFPMGLQFKIDIPIDYAAMSLAAHSGLPTSVIDFSESPLVAAWFAAKHRQDGRAAGARFESDRISVYEFNALKAKRGSPIPPEDSRFSLFNVPNLSNNRARVQRAIMLIPFKFYYDVAFSETEIDEIAHKRITDLHEVRQIDLHEKHVPELLTILGRNGFSQSTMMQDVGHIADAVVNACTS